MIRPGVRRRFALGLLIATCSCGWFAATAAAEFGPIHLVSKSAREQASFGREPALSADGQFVAFDGELGGHQGIFRKDLATGAFSLVVEGSASAPSISADGRYVSFDTTQSLDPAADPEPGTEDVYIADLASTSPSYELASSSGGERMAGSSVAAPRAALSADGSQVAFVNERQVYVRRLAAAEPTLITVKRESDGAITDEPVPGGGAYQEAGAAISADGNAVAWVGEHLPEQVPLLGAEEADVRMVEAGGAAYHEPLWRLVPTGVDARPPARRIVGGYDPLAPGCAGSAAETACQGPFLHMTESARLFNVRNEGSGLGWGLTLPQLSADGSEVATIGYPEEMEDLFVVDMAPGLSRSAAMRQLTRWTNPAPGLGPIGPKLISLAEYLIFTAPIRECAISPDGEQIAFTTQRQVFPLSPPNLITPRPISPPEISELYEINLEADTIERATPGTGTAVSTRPGFGIEEGTLKAPEGGWGATSPSYGDGGSLIAFASQASNLVPGDANGQSDVFTVESKPPAPVESSSISPRPSAIGLPFVWRLSARAVSRPDGAVRIIATVPGAGTLRAAAKSQVGSRLRSRKVGSAQRSARFAGVVRLELGLPRRLRGLARRKGGLVASFRIDFSGQGGKPLSQQLVARFRAHRKAAPGAGGRK